MYKATLQFKGQLADLLDTSPVKSLCADLSLGAWQSFTVARDYFKQCGLAFPDLTTLRATSDDLNDNFSYGTIIGKGIDAEAKGNQPLIIASNLARILAHYLLENPALDALYCLEPFESESWRTEDIYFLETLDFFVRNSVIRIILLATNRHPSHNRHQKFKVNIKEIALNNSNSLNVEVGQYDHHSDINASLLPLIIPGTLEQGGHFSDDISKHDLGMFTINGSVIIDPFERPNLNEVRKHQFESLAQQSSQIQWLNTYSQMKGSSYFLNTNQCARNAWQFYKEGAEDLALEIMQHIVVSTKDPLSRAVFLCQLQGMRISLKQFKAAAAEKVTRKNMPGTLYNFLLIALGWGQVFSGSPREAKVSFSQVENTDQEKNLIEYLYFLNISALTEARLDNLERSFELEHKIAKEHEALPLQDQMLNYVNSLNTARLYRWVKQFEYAKSYYQKAFTTTDGCRTETDFFFKYSSYALLAEATNGHIKAFEYWYITALYWLSSEYPEAIGERSLAVLIRNPTSLSSTDLVDKLAKVLYEKIVHAASHHPAIQSAQLDELEKLATSQRDDVYKSTKIVHFDNLTTTEQLANLSLGKIDNYWLWSSTNESDAEESPYISGLANTMKLKYLLCKLLQVLNTQELTSLSTPKSLYFSGYDHLDLPDSPEMASLIAQYYAFEYCDHEGQIIRCAQYPQKDDSLLSIRVASPVNFYDIENHAVFFKRYLAPIQLSAFQAELMKMFFTYNLNQFEQQSGIVSHWQPISFIKLIKEYSGRVERHVLLETLRELQQQKVLTFQLRGVNDDL